MQQNQQNTKKTTPFELLGDFFKFIEIKLKNVLFNIFFYHNFLKLFKYFKKQTKKISFKKKNNQIFSIQFLLELHTF